MEPRGVNGAKNIQGTSKQRKHILQSGARQRSDLHRDTPFPAQTASASAGGLASPPPRSPPRSPLGRLPRAPSEPRAGGPSLWADTGKRRESERVPVLGSRGCCLLLLSPPHLLCKHGSGLRGWAGTSAHLHGDLGDSVCFGRSLPAPASLLVSSPHRDPVQPCSWGRGWWRQTVWWGRGRLVAGPDHSPYRTVSRCFCPILIARRFFKSGHWLPGLWLPHLLA